MPFGAQTCCTKVTWGRGGYLSPGSQFYPTCGGAQSESGGWSDLTPLPGTPLPGTGYSISVLGRRPGKYGPPWGVGGGFPPLVSTPHTVLSLTMCQKRARCDFHSALWAFFSPPLALPKCWTLPPHLSRIGLLRNSLQHMSWLAYYANRLCRVCPQDDLVDEAREDFKLPLYPLLLGQRQDVVIVI